jgi:hypothetical protein
MSGELKREKLNRQDAKNAKKEKGGTKAILLYFLIVLSVSVGALGVLAVRRHDIAPPGRLWA